MWRGVETGVVSDYVTILFWFVERRRTTTSKDKPALLYPSRIHCQHHHWRLLLRYLVMFSNDYLQWSTLLILLSDVDCWGVLLMHAIGPCHWSSSRHVGYGRIATASVSLETAQPSYLPGLVPGRQSQRHVRPQIVTALELWLTRVTCKLVGWPNDNKTI